MTDSPAVSVEHADDIDTYFRVQREAMRVLDAFTLLSQPIVTTEWFRRYEDACRELDPFRVVDRA